MEHCFYEKVREYTKKNRMLEDVSVVIAGVSGGGDSMAMLDMLDRMSREKHFILRVVHVNHGIRGKEAERDQHMVEEECARRGILCRVYRYDVPELSARWKAGHEETGRRVRREAFEKEREAAKVEMAGKQDAEPADVRIAIAHNQNDLAETMLHHLARGTGIRGLCSMKPVSGSLIRPLLCLTRKEIEEYLKEENISSEQDSTNSGEEYTRNRIRAKVLPAMEREINSCAAAHLAELSGLMGEAEEYLSERGHRLAEQYRQEADGYLFTEDFSGQPEILKKYAVMDGISCLSGQRKDLALVHVRMVLSLFKLQVGAEADLPGGVAAVRTYTGVWLGRGRKRKIEMRADQEYPDTYLLPVPGTLQTPMGEFVTKIFPYLGQKICEKKYTKWLNYDKIVDGLSVRTRRNGDFIAITSREFHKKLTRCMIDDKIPREQRDHIPVVASGSEIFWIVGGRISERYKIIPATRYVLEIKYQGKNTQEYTNMCKTARKKEEKSYE